MPFPLTAVAVVKIGGPEHVASFGPYRENVISPVGAEPLLSVAAS